MADLGHQNTEKYQHRTKKKNILHGKIHTNLKLTEIIALSLNIVINKIRIIFRCAILAKNFSL